MWVAVIGQGIGFNLVGTRPTGPKGPADAHRSQAQCPVRDGIKQETAGRRLAIARSTAATHLTDLQDAYSVSSGRSRALLDRRAGPGGIRGKSRGADGRALLRSGAMSWLPDEFVHPVLVPLPGCGHHLRPIREADTPLDYPAVMGSRERLWTIFGPAWGWPAATMSYEADQADLLRHEKEIAAHQSFNYALFDAAETALLGCVYIDPPERAGADGEISWWVVDELVGSKVEQALDALVPQWIAADWPFEQPRFIGREISWSDWLALPEHPDT